MESKDAEYMCVNVCIYINVFIDNLLIHFFFHVFMLVFMLEIVPVFIILLSCRCILFSILILIFMFASMLTFIRFSINVSIFCLGSHVHSSLYSSVSPYVSLHAYVCEYILMCLYVPMHICICTHIHICIDISVQWHCSRKVEGFQQKPYLVRFSFGKTYAEGL